MGLVTRFESLYAVSCEAEEMNIVFERHVWRRKSPDVWTVVVQKRRPETLKEETETGICRQFVQSEKTLNCAPKESLTIMDGVSPEGLSRGSQQTNIGSNKGISNRLITDVQYLQARLACQVYFFMTKFDCFTTIFEKSTVTFSSFIQFLHSNL